MEYSKEEREQIVNDVCKEIENGNSLRRSLAMPNMPNKATFLRWVKDDSDICDQYTRAMEERAETIFEDILTIADQTSNDTIETEDGNTVTDHDVINRARLRIDSRKWMLGKMQPQKYGDKLEIKSKNTNLNIELTEEEKREHLNEIKKGLSELNDY